MSLPLNITPLVALNIAPCALNVPPARVAGHAAADPVHHELAGPRAHLGGVLAASRLPQDGRPYLQGARHREVPLPHHGLRR
eukprot:3396935-Pyramimonas_sp.AAC.1